MPGGNRLAAMTLKGKPDRARHVPRFAGLALFAVLCTALSMFSGAAPASAMTGAESLPPMSAAISERPGLLLAQDDSEPASEGAETPEEGQAVGSEPPQDGTPQTETGDNAAAGEDGPGQPLPEVITDLEQIPFPARKMRDLILEAARSGDVEKLRPYLGYGDDVTMLSLGGHDEDPIEFLKSLSGDPDGHEILAIMTEILEAPLVKTEEVPGEVVYVWPYFYAYPFDKLTPQQRVEMYRIITHGDYEEMTQFGSYIFYRLGITPEGRWRFFVAGD